MSVAVPSAKAMNTGAPLSPWSALYVAKVWQRSLLYDRSAGTSTQVRAMRPRVHPVRAPTLSTGRFTSGAPRPVTRNRGLAGSITREPV